MDDVPVRGDPRSVRLRRFPQEQVVAGVRGSGGGGVCERTAPVDAGGRLGDDTVGKRSDG